MVTDPKPDLPLQSKGRRDLRARTRIAHRRHATHRLRVVMFTVSGVPRLVRLRRKHGGNIVFIKGGLLESNSGQSGLSNVGRFELDPYRVSYHLGPRPPRLKFPRKPVVSRSDHVILLNEDGEIDERASEDSYAQAVSTAASNHLKVKSDIFEAAKSAPRTDVSSLWSLAFEESTMSEGVHTVVEAVRARLPTKSRIVNRIFTERDHEEACRVFNEAWVKSEYLDDPLKFRQLFGPLEEERLIKFDHVLSHRAVEVRAADGGTYIFNHSRVSWKGHPNNIPVVPVKVLVRGICSKCGDQCQADVTECGPPWYCM